jgi:hypothetical protein
MTTILRGPPYEAHRRRDRCGCFITTGTSRRPVVVDLPVVHLIAATRPRVRIAAEAFWPTAASMRAPRCDRQHKLLLPHPGAQLHLLNINARPEATRATLTTLLNWESLMPRNTRIPRSAPAMPGMA